MDNLSSRIPRLIVIIDWLLHFYMTTDHPKGIYVFSVHLDLDEKFQLEPVSTDLAVSKRLVLTCLPPEGDPNPEVG